MIARAAVVAAVGDLDGAGRDRGLRHALAQLLEPQPRDDVARLAAHDRLRLDPQLAVLVGVVRAGRRRHDGGRDGAAGLGVVRVIGIVRRSERAAVVAHPGRPGDVGALVDVPEDGRGRVARVGRREAVLVRAAAIDERVAGGAGARVEARAGDRVDRRGARPRRLHHEALRVQDAFVDVQRRLALALLAGAVDSVVDQARGDERDREHDQREDRRRDEDPALLVGDSLAEAAMGHMTEGTVTLIAEDRAVRQPGSRTSR